MNMSIFATPTYLCGFSEFIHNLDDILLAELTAIYHGCMLTRVMNISEFVCYTKSLLCINLITDPAMNFHDK